METLALCEKVRQASPRQCCVIKSLIARNIFIKCINEILRVRISKELD